MHAITTTTSSNNETDFYIQRVVLLGAANRLPPRRNLARLLFSIGILQVNSIV